MLGTRSFLLGILLSALPLAMYTWAHQAAAPAARTIIASSDAREREVARAKLENLAWYYPIDASVYDELVEAWRESGSVAESRHLDSLYHRLTGAEIGGRSKELDGR